MKPFPTAIALLMAIAIALQVWRDRGWQAYEPATPVMWFSAGPTFSRMTLGYGALMSDVYWMRAVIYFGRQRLSKAEEKNYDLLYPMLDLVTSLDRRFTIAYRFGAIFLSEASPGGPGRPDLAIALLQRGIERNPNSWELPHDLGFVYFWNYRDYRSAAAWFQRAGERPGAPQWLKGTAAMTLARGGDRASAREIWRQMYEGADNAAMRNIAELRVAQFDALDAIDALSTIVWRYEARVGRFPASWRELVEAGVLRGEPLDPAGVPFILDATNEDVRISPRSPLSPLPDWEWQTS